MILDASDNHTFRKDNFAISHKMLNNSSFLNAI